MKRLIVIILVLQLLFLTGCTFPFFGKPSSDQTPGTAEGQEMLKVGEDEQTNSTGSGISDNTSADAAGGIANGASNDSSTAAGAEAAGAESTADASGVAADSSVLSVSTGTDPNSEGSSPEQTTTGSGTDLSAASSVSSSQDTGAVPAGNRYPVTVYYQDGDGYLVPMTRWIQMQQGLARVAVSLCIDSAIAREEVAYYGVYPVIPADTDILGIDIREGIATIDFDRHLLNYNDASAERNIIASIVYTMTEFKTIDKVRILINGYPQDTLKYGIDVSEALGREDISINTNTAKLGDGSGKTDIFLFKKANEGFTYLVPVSVPDKAYSGELPEVLVKQLLGESVADSLYTEMPDGAELLECSVKNDTLTLNFSEDFIKYGGNMKEEGILKQLAYTIRQVEGIKRLMILVEGRKAELPEGTDVSAGVAVPATINDVMDR